ncbi:CinA family protein [Vibrio sp.]|uniref:CinA family protein n=1 Tax=Vibrio sp. TaxID=678 RepID=UPI003D0E95BA
MEVQSQLSQQVGSLLEQHRQVLASAESCTGGAIAATVTDTAGSSAWFDRAFITYSNQAKLDMLSVSEKTLAQYGAVSEAVAVEMVQGALDHSLATIAVAVSGIAGPTGGSEEKPVGTVCFAWADSSGWQHVQTCHFDGDRGQVRTQAVNHALQVICAHLRDLS